MEYEELRRKNLVRSLFSIGFMIISLILMITSIYYIILVVVLFIMFLYFNVLSKLYDIADSLKGGLNVKRKK